MNKIINKNLKLIIEESQKFQEELTTLQNKQRELELHLSKLHNAKSFKLWQKFNKIKKILLGKNEN